MKYDTWLCYNHELPNRDANAVLGLVPMFVPKDFFRRRLICRADTRHNAHARWNSRISARRSEAKQNPWLRTLELSRGTCYQFCKFWAQTVKTEARYPSYRLYYKPVYNFYKERNHFNSKPIYYTSLTYPKPQVYAPESYPTFIRSVSFGIIMVRWKDSTFLDLTFNAFKFWTVSFIPTIFYSQKASILLVLF